MSDLEDTFHKLMKDTYYESERSINYRPTYFLRMVNEQGGVATAHRLLEGDDVSEGFTRLWEGGRLDLSAEALVLKPEFAPLFSEEERTRARKRLEEVGYTPPWLMDQAGADVATAGAAEPVEDDDDAELAIDIGGRNELPLTEWQRQTTSSNPLAQRLIIEYPKWLQQTFGNSVHIHVGESRDMLLSSAGRYIQHLSFNPKHNLYVLIYDPAPDDIRMLREVLSRPHTLKEKSPYVVDVPGRTGYRFFVATQGDYSLLQQLTRRQVTQLQRTDETRTGANRDVVDAVGVEAASASQPAPSIVERPQRAVQNVEGGAGTTRKAWIFQANRDQFDLPAALGQVTKFTWLVRQHQTEIHTGDIVYFWESGPERGVLAVARVMSEPRMMPDDPESSRFYRRSNVDNETEELRVWVEVEHVLPERILYREFERDLILRDAIIMRRPQGTNFRLTEAEAARIAEIVESRLTDDELGDDEETGDFASLAEWQANVQTSDRIAGHIVQDYPRWLRFTFGDRVELRLRKGQHLALAIGGRNHLNFTFNNDAPLRVRMTKVDAPEVAYIRNHLSDPGNLWEQAGKYRFRIATEGDYGMLKEVTRRMVNRIAPPGQMRLVDAAYMVLDEAEGALHLKDIWNRIQQRDLFTTAGKTPTATLATMMLRDRRFANLGKNMWVLQDAGMVDPSTPDTGFWRIHFPRELWDEAHANGVVGIDWPPDSVNQSVTRFKRVKVGDRIVAYVQSGTIGGVGIVTRPFFDLRLEDEPGEGAGLFGGAYAQRIGVAWADAPARPVDLLDQLKAPEHTALYNRLKNPHTVMPLSKDDYVTVLRLLGVPDVAPPSAETRLPSAWPRLATYRDFAQVIDVRPYSADELYQLAQQFGEEFNTGIDQEELVTQLRQLRVLVRSAEGYAPQPFVAGDASALLRLMALAMLVPVEGSTDLYMLPARIIWERLQDGGTGDFDAFAPDLGADGPQILQWYEEAGLAVIEDTTWRVADGALSALPGDDPAVMAFNDFIATLRSEHEGSLTADLPDASGLLPQSPALEARLHELGEELLIDDAIVRRIYRSLLAGRHIVLSGPPGTGKTELAKRLPVLLWREAPQSLTRLTTDLDSRPVATWDETRHGYFPLLVTATEDWGVRDVVGGIAPRLEGGARTLSYDIQYGALTRAILQHYEGTDGGRRLPAQTHRSARRDYRSDGRRYRGAWLVIDEFTRAPVDAAFGSLLTTLSGSTHAHLAVPTTDGEAQLPLPEDFRIIGTLNSFDRHFLNQISEAMKRRFDFIDVMPPAYRDWHYERGIAAAQALSRLRANGFDQILAEGEPPVYRWPDQIQVEPATDPQGRRRYNVVPLDDGAGAALDSFARIFAAIRIFRQLGTAQMVAIYSNLFAGTLVGMPWEEALDTALADSLADQLQVMARDEQRILQMYLQHAGDPGTFAAQFGTLRLNAGATRTLLYTLREAEQARTGTTAPEPDDLKAFTEARLRALFELGAPLALPVPSVFMRRVRDLIGERGL